MDRSLLNETKTFKHLANCHVPCGGTPPPPFEHPPPLPAPPRPSPIPGPYPPTPPPQHLTVASLSMFFHLCSPTQHLAVDSASMFFSVRGPICKTDLLHHTAETAHYETNSWQRRWAWGRWWPMIWIRLGHSTETPCLSLRSGRFKAGWFAEGCS